MLIDIIERQRDAWGDARCAKLPVELDWGYDVAFDYPPRTTGYEAER